MPMDGQKKNKKVDFEGENVFYKSIANHNVMGYNVYEKMNLKQRC